MFIDDDLQIKKLSNIDEEEKALVEAFSCGKDHIDAYLKEDALEDLKFGITKTFLFFMSIEGEKQLISYFSLTTDRVTVTKKSNAAQTLATWENPVKRTSIPGIQIHHFAVDSRFQGQGHGANLIYYIFEFIKATILPHLGACLITVQSEKDVKGFYSTIGFVATEQQRDCNVSMAFPTNDFFDKE